MSSLNETPSGERLHIGFFGRRNVGKSSLVNAVTGQNLSVVSHVAGTTTDSVGKAMELLPLGPVMVMDTPGIDDEGYLGEKRVKAAEQVLRKIDAAVLVTDVQTGMGAWEHRLTDMFEKKGIPFLIVFNKQDLMEQTDSVKTAEGVLYTDAVKGVGVEELKERLSQMGIQNKREQPLVQDLVQENDVVVLVTPMDGSAPKGRLILPQQQMIRDVLEAGGAALAVQERQLKQTLQGLSKPPAMVITDSQVFQAVAQIVPLQVPLTSFSILMARYKGFLDTAVQGANALDRLKSGDRVLISEGCTHHRQCEDIGAVKLPNWLREYTGKELEIEVTGGRAFPEDLTSFAMVIHCGGCMLNGREMMYRMKQAARQGIPFTNYGIAIAQMKGILQRSIAMLKQKS